MELSRFEEELAAAAENLRGRTRGCARNAFHGIRKAYSLVGNDDEMAAFRAITAEEEAATAVYFAIKEAGYPGADELNFRDHSHKACLYHFIAAVSVLFEKLFHGKTFDIQLDKSVPRIDVFMSAEHFFGSNAKGERISPDEPLNFSIHDEFRTYDFAKEWERIASAEGRAKILDFVKREANLRNKLIYATEAGIPIINNALYIVKRQRSRVVMLVAVAICIQQTRSHQIFVSQSIAIIALIMRGVRDHFDGIKYPSIGEEGIFVHRDESGLKSVRVIRQVCLRWPSTWWFAHPQVTVNHTIAGPDPTPVSLGRPARLTPEG